MSIFKRFESVPFENGQTDSDETSVPADDAGQTDENPEETDLDENPETGETEDEDQTEDKDQPGETDDDDDFEIPEKFRGKSAKEIAKAYVELEKLRERQVQERVQQELERLKKEIQQPEDNTPAADETQQEPEVEIDPEEVNQRFEEQFYERPAETVAQMAEIVARQVVEQALEPFKPLVQAYQQQQIQMTVNEAISEMERKYPDFSENIPNVEKILRDKPELQKLPPLEALEIAYKLHIAENLPKEKEKIEEDVKKRLTEKKNAYLSGTKGDTKTVSRNPIEEERERLTRPREPIFKLS